MTQTPIQEQGRNAAALEQAANGGAVVCPTCDGTTWTPHGTKGLTRCQQCNSGILKPNAQIR